MKELSGSDDGYVLYFDLSFQCIKMAKVIELCIFIVYETVCYNNTPP